MLWEDKAPGFRQKIHWSRSSRKRSLRSGKVNAEKQLKTTEDDTTQSRGLGFSFSNECLVSSNLKHILSKSSPNSSFLCSPTPITTVKSTKSATTTIYLDTGASLTAVNNLLLLNPTSITKLLEPIRLGVITSSVILTYTGTLLHFPPPFNSAFYSSSLSSNILSMGAILRLEGRFGSDPLNQHLLILKTSIYGAIIGTAMLFNNNLLPMELLPSCPSALCTSTDSNIL